MSLKAFHIVFITVSTLLSFGVGGWAYKSWQQSGALVDLIYGICAVVSGVILIAYGNYFLKKLRNIGYL